MSPYRLHLLFFIIRHLRVRLIYGLIITLFWFKVILFYYCICCGIGGWLALFRLARGCRFRWGLCFHCLASRLLPLVLSIIGIVSFLCFDCFGSRFGCGCFGRTRHLAGLAWKRMTHGVWADLALGHWRAHHEALVPGVKRHVRSFSSGGWSCCCWLSINGVKVAIVLGLEPYGS